jgi:predicted MFS family arabinose efflux permease
MRTIIFALALANFGVGTGGLIIAGVLPQIAASLAVSLAQAGALVGYASVAYALAAPLLGAALGTLDRKHVLLGGLILMTLSSVIGALSTHYELLLGSRILFALASAVVTPTSLIIAAFVSHPEERGRSISRVFGGFALSNVIGLPLGVLIASFGDWHLSLWYAAAVSAVAAILVARYLPSRILVPATGFAILGQLMLDWRKMLVIFVAVLQMGSVFVLYTYLTSWLSTSLGATGQTITWLLLWFGVFGTIGVFGSGEVMRRIGVRALMATSLVLVAVVHTSFSWMPVSLLTVMIMLAFWGAVGFVFQPAQQTRVIQVCGASASAGISLQASGVYIGQALGAFVGGAVLATAGIGTLGWVAGLGALLTLGLLLLTFRLVGNQAP